MNTIHVRFQGDYSRIPDVPVPVEVIDPNLDTVVAMTMPLDSTTPVNVSAPGLYLVRASLPSGERVSASVTIPSPNSVTPNPSAIATLIPHDLSPRESDAWAYSLQGIQRAVDGNPNQKTSLESLAMSYQDIAPMLSLTPSGIYWNAEKDSNGIFHLMANDDKDQVISVTSVVNNDSRVLMRMELKRTQLYNSEPTQWKPCYQRFDFSNPEQQGNLLFAVPPLPETEIVLVQSTDATMHPVRPLVKGGDPKTDALLSYLSQGAFEEARAIGGSISDGDIQELLYGKRRDPSSAVIAVYYMLRAGTVDRLDWVKNLADWFPLIPDGAVQYGWCLLRQNNPDHNLARSYFLIAAKRGIPIFSYGVRLLYDGLNMFAERNPNDIEISIAFRAVRHLAAISDWRSAVTSLAFSQTRNLITEFINADDTEEEQVRARLEIVKASLDWDNTTGSARKWWEAFENENKHRTSLVLRLAEELANRKATITEFFLAYVYSNTDNIQANLCYLDYTRLKKEEERKRKEAAEKNETYRDSWESSHSELSDGSPTGITNTRSWTDGEIAVKLEEVKSTLDWDNTTGSARKWWEAFENENKHRTSLVLRLAEELANRKATITEFFLAYVYSNTDNIQANLCYLDYTRLKKEEERKRKEAAEKNENAIS